jgi:uroporphyrinogen-III synthase
MSALRGKRIVVTRARERAEGLYEQLQALGAVPILLPAIEITALEDYADVDDAIQNLKLFDWIIFTSANGVRAFWQRLALAGVQPSSLGDIAIAAIGPVTASAAEEHGFRVRVVADQFVAENILEVIGDVSGKRIMLPRADIARKEIVAQLQQRGAYVRDVAVYRTIAAEPDQEALIRVRTGVDVVTFTSSSTVRHFHAMLGGAPEGALIACVGPVTAETARELGYPVSIVADEYTTDGLVHALEKHYAAHAAKHVSRA